MSMQPARSLHDIGLATKKDQFRRKQPNIILTSKEGEEFVVPLEIAQRSLVLKDILSNFEEQKTKVIPLREIDSTTLNALTEIMWAAYNHRDLKGKALLDTLDKDVKLKNDQIIPVLIACDLLEFTLGIKLIAKQHIINNEKLRREIIDKVESKQLSDNTAKEINKIYFLINNAPLYSIGGAQSVSLSVRDLFDYQPFYKKKHISKSSRLNLRGVQINDLDGLFDIPGIENITSLDLADNHLTELPENFFINLSNLQELDLGLNQFKQLPATIFAPLKNMKKLFLYRNQLTVLPDSIFATLVNLQELSLRQNQLAELPSTIFANLNNLRNLSLGSNQLMQLPATIFANLHNLEALYLYENQLTQLPDSIFTELIKLRQLDLADNQLKQLPAIIFNNLFDLKELQLHRNQLMHLPDTLFAKLVNLQRLGLASNQLTQLPAILFANFGNLHELDLEDNKLTQLPVTIFENLRKLQKLYLRNNQLRQLPATMFANLRSLQELFLTGNQLNDQNKQQIKDALPRVKILL